MKANIGITIEELKEVLHYDENTGIFTWIAQLGPRKPGYIVNTQVKHRYIRIRVYGVLYKAHRLAWFYVHGDWPIGVIDHVDHNPKNNTLINLRDVPQKVNTKNCTISSNNTSGINGVYWCNRRGKWCAEIMVNYKKKHLGYYTELFDAKNARIEANTLYGFHETHGVML